MEEQLAESSMDPATMFFVFPLLLLLLLLLRSITARRAATRHGDRLPPSPTGRRSTLPIIGHLHLVLGSQHPPHVSLRDLAERHGRDGLLLLRLGQVPNLVASSPRAAEAILRAHDHAFASRPPSAVAAVLFDGPSDVALAPYGELWRQNRKLVTTHLLSARKVLALRRAREEEARLVVSRIRTEAGAVVDLSDVVGAFVNDVLCRAVSGKFSRDRGRNRTFRELSSGNSELLGGFNLDDFFPGLGKVALQVTGGRVVCAKARRLKKRWDDLLDDIIDEHATTKSSSRLVHSNDNEDQEEEDFIDVLLSLEQEYDGLTREQVRVLLLEMFAAGTDTSSIVLEYAMVELVRNPRVMAKLRAEIISTMNNTNSTHHSQQRKEVDDMDMVKEENLHKMTYLKAVVTETLRLHPPVPLLLPRLSMQEERDVNGYTVPAGTRVIVNAWALGRDTESWGDRAEEFMPERFLREDDDSSGSFIDDSKGAKRDFRFVPFGAGRRMCPGMNFAMATVEIMLANLVYCFDWELPTGTKAEDVDMTDVFGLTMRRRQKLLLVPRLLLINNNK